MCKCLCVTFWAYRNSCRNCNETYGEWIHFVDWSPFLQGRLFFMTSCLLYCAVNPFWKGGFSISKEFGSKFLPYKVNHCLEGDKSILTVVSLESINFPSVISISVWNANDDFLAFFLFFIFLLSHSIVLILYSLGWDHENTLVFE